MSTFRKYHCRRQKTQRANQSSLLLPAQSPLLPASQLEGRLLAHPLLTWQTGDNVEFAFTQSIQLNAQVPKVLLYEGSKNRSTPDHSSSVLLTAWLTWDVHQQAPRVIERHFSLPPHGQPNVSRFRMDDYAVAIDRCTAMLRRDIERLSRCKLSRPSGKLSIQRQA